MAFWCPLIMSKPGRAALQRLLDDDILRQRLGATAHADFLARHTWRRRASRVLESFESSNAGAGTGRP